MICQRCLTRSAQRTASNLNATTRTFTHSSPKHAEAVTAATTTQTSPRPHGRPAATSTAAAQPFSTPLSPNPRIHEDDPLSPHNAAAEVKKRQRTPSSVPAGTVLRGLNFMKGKADPVALEDAEYPDWLWEVLRSKQEGEGALGAEGEGDLFSKSKKQRRKAAKALRRQQLMGQDDEVQVPLYEQSVDLAGASGDARQERLAREGLTGAMRKERRRKIKEGNFLKAMG